MESACDDASCKAGKESNCDAVRHRRRVGAASQGRACLHQQQADLTLGSQGLQKSDGHDCEDDAALLHEHVGTFAPLALEKLLQVHRLSSCDLSTAVRVLVQPLAQRRALAAVNATPC